MYFVSSRTYFTEHFVSCCIIENPREFSFPASLVLPSLLTLAAVCVAGDAATATATAAATAAAAAGRKIGGRHDFFRFFDNKFVHF